MEDNDNQENGDGKSKTEFIKKLMTAGLSAAFMTEESIRHFLGDMKLPKDVLQGLVSGAQKSKDELMERVGNEVIKMIKKIDFVQEASRFVETHKFKISAEIEVLKKEDGPKGRSFLITSEDKTIEIK